MKVSFKRLSALVFAGCTLLALTAGGAGCVCNKPASKVSLAGSSIYTENELYDAVLLIRETFASFPGNCEVHSIRYAGDEANNRENLDWLNSLREARSDIPAEDAGKQYAQVAEFLMDFHSPVEDGPYAWELDMEYKDYQWWLARTKDGDWEVVSWGY